MKSNLKFYNHGSGTESRCSDVLEIEFSNASLGWHGVILEKGSSPHFYPDNVYTPYFYFALALEQDLQWNAAIYDGMVALKTSPGHIWINPPSTPFSHQIADPCYFVILAVEEQTFLDSYSLNIKNKAIRFLNNYNVLDETIKGIIELFLLEARGGGKNGYLYLKNLLSLLSAHYIQNYSNYPDLQNKNFTHSKFDQQQINAVDAYIEKNIGSHISVDNLADLLGYSKFYFLREFKKVVGETPYQYLLKKRLEKAQMLLLLSNDNIVSVSDELGFTDQAHFTKLFKREFGVTPAQFQKDGLPDMPDYLPRPPTPPITD